MRIHSITTIALCLAFNYATLICGSVYADEYNIKILKVPFTKDDYMQTIKYYESVKKYKPTLSLHDSKYVLIPPGLWEHREYNIESVDKHAVANKSTVILTKPYYVLESEVTIKQYNSITGYNPTKEDDDSEYPVYNVNWYTAVEYCNKLSSIHQLEGYYTIKNSIRKNGQLISADILRSNKNGFRLPTEAEYEFICIAGSNELFSTGVTIDKKVININNQESLSSKSLKPNLLGLFGVAGNLKEWCYDSYDKDFYKSNNHLINPLNESTEYPLRVRRGGSFESDEAEAISFMRDAASALHKSEVVGFRVIIDVDTSLTKAKSE